MAYAKFSYTGSFLEMLVFSSLKMISGDQGDFSSQQKGIIRSSQTGAHSREKYRRISDADINSFTLKARSVQPVKIHDRP